MVDRQFSQAKLAALYDLFCGLERRDDFDFYLRLVMAAGSVVDVGCGTGALLHQARELGHAGRLCGLDPACAMLDQARTRSDIEWVLGDLASASWDREFELVVMTGHAFQVLVHDDDLRTSLAAIRAALTEGGRFVFETRNPLVREWERWTPQHAVETRGADGVVVRMEHEVDTPVVGDVVVFTTRYTSPGWDRTEESRSTLRFLDRESLSSFLAGVGLVVEEQFGDWDRQPLTDSSPEIITVARRREERPPRRRPAPIETARLRLVPLTAGDAEELHPILDDVALHRFVGGVPLDPPALLDRFRRLEAGAPAEAGEAWCNWVVRLAETGAAVGAVQATVRADEAVVAWVIGVSAQGRGYASEAARALVALLLDGGTTRVTAHIHPDHGASAAVARHAGLVSTRRVDDEGEVVWERTAAG